MQIDFPWSFKNNFSTVCFFFQADIRVVVVDVIYTDVIKLVCDFLNLLVGENTQSPFHRRSQFWNVVTWNQESRKVKEVKEHLVPVAEEVKIKFGSHSLVHDENETDCELIEYPPFSTPGIVEIIK